MDNLGKKIALNTIISGGTRIIELILAFIIIGILTRYLGKSGFGEYSIILAFIFIFNVLADFGLYSIVVREISKPGADEEKIASNAFTIRFLIGFFIFTSAFLIACLFPYSAIVKQGILIGAFGFWFLSMGQVLMGVFQKYLRMDKVAIAELIARIIQVILILWFVKLGFGLLFIISAIVISSFIYFLFVFIFAQKYVRVRFQFDFVFWKKILRQSWPLAISAILCMIYFKLDTIFLSVMKSEGDVGIYGLSYKILESIVFFPAMFVGLVMPLLSKYAFTDLEKFKRVFQRALDFLIISAIPLAIGTLFLSPKIIFLLSGGGFEESVLVLNILIFACAMIFFGALFSNVIITRNLQKTLAKIYLAGATVNVVANFIFIPRYSYYGAASTTLFTEMLVTVLMLIVIFKSLQYLPSFKIFFKAFFASIIMALPLYFFQEQNLFILLPAAIGIYFLILYLIKGISKEDISMIIRKEPFNNKN
jgi:O-antigen/teichoic acid export membrane protein